MAQDWRSGDDHPEQDGGPPGPIGDGVGRGEDILRARPEDRRTVTELQMSDRYFPVPDGAGPLVRVDSGFHVAADQVGRGNAALPSREFPGGTVSVTLAETGLLPQPGTWIAEPTGRHIAVTFDPNTVTLGSFGDLRQYGAGIGPATDQSQQNAIRSVLALAGADQLWTGTQRADWQQRWETALKPGVDAYRGAHGLPPSPREAPTGIDRLGVAAAPIDRASAIAMLTGATAAEIYVRGHPQPEQIYDMLYGETAKKMPVMAVSGDRAADEGLSPGTVYGLRVQPSGLLQLYYPGHDSHTRPLRRDDMNRMLGNGVLSGHFDIMM